MEFIKITISDSEKEVNQKFDNTTPEYQSIIDKLYESFEYIKFDNLEGELTMFAVVSKDIINKISIHFNMLGLDYKIENITKKVLLGEKQHIRSWKNLDSWYQGNLDEIVQEFQEKYLTVDFILDKISEKGKESLTEIDKKVLANS